MNPFNRILLAFVLLPQKLYRQWGIDMPRLTSILTTKLVMDDRRPNTLQVARQRRDTNKEISRATLGTMLISGLMGLSFLMAFSLSDDFITQLTLYFSMFITMLCMSLVSDFTSVLIDIRDTQIILPKPVNDSTFVLARLLHIFIYICKILLPMCLPAVVYVSYSVGIPTGLTVLATAVLATLFAIFLINAVYIIILRITTPEKFKNIISYIQIAFAILIYAGYQILPRMMEDPGAIGLDVSNKTAMLVAPPWWFACVVQYLTTGHGTQAQLAGAALAILFPITSMYLVVRYLAPAFNQKLAMISGGEGPAETVVTTREVRGKGLAEQLSVFLTGNKAERAGFLFTWKMMARSREFRIRVYPSIGYFVVIIFMLFFKNRSAMAISNTDTYFSFKPMAAIYFSSIVITVAVSQMIYSDKFRASWIFFIVPVPRPGEIISGALKATVFQFAFFMAILTFGGGLWMAGPAILPNLILAVCNQILITYAIAMISFRQLPFSQPIGTAQKTGQFARSLSMMFFSLVVGSTHYFIYKYNIAVGVFLLVSLVALWLMTRHIRQLRWDTLQIQE